MNVTCVGNIYVCINLISSTQVYLTRFFENRNTHALIQVISVSYPPKKYWLIPNHMCKNNFFSMFTLTHKNCSFFRSLCYACKGLLKPITHTQIKCASLGFYWLKEVKNVWNSCHQKIHGSKMMRNLILSIICLIISFSYTLKNVISSDDLEYQWSKMNKNFPSGKNCVIVNRS